MKKLLLGVAAACVLSFNVWAEDGLLKTGHPDEYTVKKGDTLWDISSTFLNSPWKWPEVWHANPQIENPHLIYPGDLIRLVYIDGEAKLTSERTLKLTPGANGSAGVTKLSPSVRVLDGNRAISSIPLDRIDAFLSHARIVSEKELEASPYVVAGPQKRIVVGMGDDAYVRGKLDERIGNYGVYRRGEVYRDPFTNEVLGLNALGIGSVSLKSQQADVATVRVIRTYEEIRMGDRLLPTEESSTSSIFYPSSPEVEPKNAVVIAVEGGVTQVGKLNVVVINKGERDNLKSGNVLAIYKKGEQVIDRVAGGRVQLPDERAGLLMVFKTFHKMSYGLVLEADRPLAVGDTLRNP